MNTNFMPIRYAHNIGVMPGIYVEIAVLVQYSAFCDSFTKIGKHDFILFFEIDAMPIIKCLKIFRYLHELVDIVDRSRT